MGKSSEYFLRFLLQQIGSFMLNLEIISFGFVHKLCRAFNDRSFKVDYDVKYD